MSEEGSNPIQHGIGAAYYSNLPGPKQTAVLVCLCGKEFAGATEFWSDAGYALDEHLAEVTKQ